MEKEIFSPQPIDPRHEVPDDISPLQRFLLYAGGVGRVDTQRIAFTRELGDALQLPLSSDVKYPVLVRVLENFPAVCEPLEIEVRCAVAAQFPAVCRAVVAVTIDDIDGDAAASGAADGEKGARLQLACERVVAVVFPALQRLLFDDFRVVRTAAVDALVAMLNELVAFVTNAKQLDATACSVLPVSPKPSSHNADGSLKRVSSGRFKVVNQTYERPFERMFEMCPSGYSAIAAMLMQLLQQMAAHETHWYRSLVPKIFSGCMPFLLGQKLPSKEVELAEYCLRVVQQLTKDDSEVVKGQLAKNLPGMWCAVILCTGAATVEAEEQLRETVVALAVDYDAGVRTAIATSLPAIAAFSRPSALEQYLGEVFNNLLNDEEDRVAVAAGNGIAALMALIAPFADAEVSGVDADISIASVIAPTPRHRRNQSMPTTATTQLDRPFGFGVGIPRTKSDPSALCAADAGDYFWPRWYLRSVLASAAGSSWLGVEVQDDHVTARSRYSVVKEINHLLLGRTTASLTQTSYAVCHARKCTGPFLGLYRALMCQLVAFAHGSVFGERSANRDTILGTPLYTGVSPSIGIKTIDEEDEASSDDDDSKLIDIDEIIEHDDVVHHDVIGSARSPSSLDEESDNESVKDILEADFEDEFTVGDVRNRRIEHAANALPGVCLPLVALSESLDSLCQEADTGSNISAFQTFRELCHRMVLVLYIARKISESADPNGKATITLLAGLPDVMICLRLAAQAISRASFKLHLLPSSSPVSSAEELRLSPEQQAELQRALIAIDSSALARFNIEVLVNALARSGNLSRQYAVSTASRLLKELPVTYHSCIIYSLLQACGLSSFAEGLEADMIKLNLPTYVVQKGDWHSYLLLLTRIPDIAGIIQPTMLATVFVPLLRRFLTDDISAVREAAIIATIHVFGALILRFNETDAPADTTRAADRKSMAMQHALAHESVHSMLRTPSATSGGESPLIDTNSELIRKELQQLLAGVLDLATRGQHHSRVTFLHLCRRLHSQDAVMELSPTSASAVSPTSSEPELPAQPLPDAATLSARELKSISVSAHKPTSSGLPQLSLLRRPSYMDLMSNGAPRATNAPTPRPEIARRRILACKQYCFEFSPFVAAAALLAGNLQAEKEVVERNCEVARYWRRRADMAQLCGLIVKDMALANDASMSIAAPEYFCCQDAKDLPSRIWTALSVSAPVVSSGQSVAEYFEALKQQKICGKSPDLDSPFYTTQECVKAAGIIYSSHLKHQLTRLLLHYRPDSHFWKAVEELVGNGFTRTARWEWIPKLKAIETEKSAREAALKRLQELLPAADEREHSLPSWPPKAGVDTTPPSSKMRRKESKDAVEQKGPQTMTLGDIAGLVLEEGDQVPHDLVSEAAPVSHAPPAHRRGRRNETMFS